MGRTPLHYAGGKHDGGFLYELIKNAGADEKIKDIVSIRDKSSKMINNI